MDEIVYEELRGNDREFKNSSSINSNVNRAQNVDIALDYIIFLYSKQKF